MSNSLINDIYNGINLEEIIKRCIRDLFYNGPIRSGVLEILSSIKYYHEDFFKFYEDEVNLAMGLFYKDSNPTTLKSTIFSINKSAIIKKMNQKFTPTQVEIIEKSNKNKVFSFSSGTSVGKSFVFRELLNEYLNDVVIIVPSRALINEYIILLEETLNFKKVNLLQHVDFVNRNNVERNIFILTPERAKSVFSLKNLFNLDLILFDEAQLADEKNIRGVLFDGIVRRFHKEFPNSKILFAHPFISNPEAQITRNHLFNVDNESKVYEQRNVGQIYFSYDDNKFYQFAVDKEALGNHKMELHFDPIERVLSNGRSILIYMPKSKIINKKYLQDLFKYRKYFRIINTEEGLKLIEEVKDILGVSRYKDSFLLRLMKFGIVIHHGSMPLDLRKKIEKFINLGLSKVCIATSTLYQGINMPFDLVWVERLELSKTLGVKNLIGRAGRASKLKGFDFGIVLIKDQNKSGFRKLMNHNEFIDEKSNIDRNFGENEIDVAELKEAIKNNDFSDKYNLTNKEVELLTSNEIDIEINKIINYLFVDNKLIPYETFKIYSTETKGIIKSAFMSIYLRHIRRKELSLGEQDVLNEGFQIMLWSILGKSFKQIAALRYFFTTKFFDEEVKDIRNQLIHANGEDKKKLIHKLSNIEAKYLVGYNDIPNINLKRYPKFTDSNILDIDYDTVIFDTYDFMDKLISLRLKDIFYATFDTYYLKTGDQRAFEISNLVKFGTNEPVRIWLLRYGFFNDDIDKIIDYVIDVNENEIVFDKSIYKIDLDIDILKRYIS